MNSAHEIAADFPAEIGSTLWGILVAQQGRFDFFFSSLDTSEAML